MKIIKAAVPLLLALLVAFALSGRRVRLYPAPEVSALGSIPVTEPVTAPPEAAESSSESPDESPDALPESTSVENPDATAREYSSDGNAEIAPEAEHSLTVQEAEADATAGSVQDSEAAPQGHQEGDSEHTATELRTSDEAEQDIAAADGEAADTCFAYYTTLLRTQLANLFECDKLYVYFEAEADYNTFNKASAEHSVILTAGGYNIGEKRQADTLTVDDGWVIRKNPGTVVKYAGTTALSGGADICQAIAARPGWGGIAAVQAGRIVLIPRWLSDSEAGRLAASLIIAREMYPALFADLDIDMACRQLLTEAGLAAKGPFVYTIK